VLGKNLIEIGGRLETVVEWRCPARALIDIRLRAIVEITPGKRRCGREEFLERCQIAIKRLYKDASG
jgi:hypothetical protein